jgi:hypothetical protein
MINFDGLPSVISLLLVILYRQAARKALPTTSRDPNPHVTVRKQAYLRHADELALRINLPQGRTSLFILLILLFSYCPVVAEPQVWFSPLDPLFRPEANYGGAQSYMQLFMPNSPWAKAAAHVSVFKIYPQWIARASDDDLEHQFADLRRRGIALALEYGVLATPKYCGRGIEGQGGQTLLAAARRIQKNGGILRYLAMDEPIYFSTMYSGHGACRWQPEQTAENVAANIRTLLQAFPLIQVGEIERLHGLEDVQQYKRGIESFRKVLNIAPAFFHADVVWDSADWQVGLAALREMVKREGILFGVIYNGNRDDPTSDAWIRAAELHMMEAESGVGTPDQVVFQSWHSEPKKLLPEFESDSFTSLIGRYFRQRVQLVAQRVGRTLTGTIGASGRPLSNVPIILTAFPARGSGIPHTYKLRGLIPIGTQRINFGIRINAECQCSGSADLRVAAFRFLPDRGRQIELLGGALNGFRNLTILPIEHIVHITTLDLRPMALNSAAVRFSGQGSYEFQVDAQVSPESNGSGYFGLFFLDASGEISRAKIPFGPATDDIGTVTSDARGRWSFYPPKKYLEGFKIDAQFDGNATFWPAKCIAGP